MPKYKVRYTFDINVEAINESTAKILADLKINPDCCSYLWKYLIDKKIINIEVPEDLKEEIETGTQTLLTFKFDDEHSYLVEVEDIEQLKPSEKYEKRILDSLINYTCHFCKDKNNCKYALGNDGHCLLEK